MAHLRTALTVAALSLALPGGALAQQGQGGGVPGLHFVENWDTDGDEIVTLEEITTRRGDVFYMFDQNEDGALDAAEYALFDETRAADMENAGGHGRRMGAANQGMSLEFNDTNGDGAVTEDEFVSRSADWVALMDRDGSGDITTADFGRN